MFLLRSEQLAVRDILTGSGRHLLAKVFRKICGHATFLHVRNSLLCEPKIVPRFQVSIRIARPDQVSSNSQFDLQLVLLHDFLLLLAQL